MRAINFNLDDLSSKKRDLLFLISFILIYIINLFIDSLYGLKQTDEVIPILVIFGLLFTSLAWLVTRNYKADQQTQIVQLYEPYLLFTLLVYITVAIIPSNKWLLSTDYQGITAEVIIIVRKVVTFFVIPFLVYKAFYKFSLSDFGLSFKWRQVVNRKSILIWMLFSALLISFNYFAGSGAKPIRDGLFTTSQIIKALPLLALWLFIEVGLVEEFFFRGLLQNRLGALLRSKTGAILMSALIFGLVHAPGMYLRQAGVTNGLGAEPTLLNSIIFCIAVQSIPGLFLGILWERTRNLWLLIGIHAMFDLMPGLAEFITVWGIK